MRLRIVFPLLLLSLLAGCGSVSLNDRCEWPADDQIRRSESLAAQVQLAEDLAIRFADAQGETPRWRSNRESCEATLFQRIADERGLSSEGVLQARRSLESRPFDWFVNLPMGVLTIALGWSWARVVFRRFGPDDWVLAGVAVVVGAAAIAVAIVGLGQVWASAIEVWRIGNGHLSYRAFRIPWPHHRAATFIIAVGTVILVSAIQLRRCRLTSA